MKNIITFITSNQRLCDRLQTALQDFVVLQTKGFPTLKKIFKKSNAVSAIILHISNPNHWILYKILKNEFPDLPLFAVTDPNAKGKQNVESCTLAARQGAIAINADNQGLERLATLIQGVANAPVGANPSDYAAYLETISNISRELQRIHTEFSETMLKTLPQPNISRNLQQRLKNALLSLQAITIAPVEACLDATNSVE